MYFDDSFHRALVDALVATDALGVIEDGEIVYHGYGAVFARLGAETATDTALLANRADVLASVVIGAGDVNGGGSGNTLDQFFGTGLGAETALDALGAVDLGVTVLGVDFYGVIGALDTALAHADAAPRAGFSTAG